MDIKRVLLALLQFLLFVLVFAAGSFFPPLHVTTVLSATTEGTRVFVWDGLLLMTLLFVLILLVEQARRRIRTAGPWTAGAFVLAALAGFALRFGFLTR